MFQKVLIANRGEIALRVIRACKELGIATVAIHSEADRKSLHVRFADESVCVGPADVQESYLNIPSIISAALLTGADAIHPGYGFLSERAEFAEICERSGLHFIGPSSGVIRTMGDKILAKEVGKRAGVPMVPGSDGAITDFSTAVKIADQIGYPVIIKASGGGGGRGMKIAQNGEELQRLMQVAQSEALLAFGNSQVYLERFFINPRHIEIQVLADRYGRVISLGERDCSIQRRFQKVVEEAPSPTLPREVSQRMGEAATELCRMVGYSTVGTVEFLADEKDNFFFIEMNTRIQVEHPITEMISGVDICKTQILLAAGDKLKLRQKDVRLSGHAIECRINAEDPVLFRPSPGTITGYHQPGGLGVRVDTAVAAGSRVLSHYDSLIAKLVVHGADRGETLRRLKWALEQYIVEGIQTNIPFHRRLLNYPAYVEGRLHTGLLREVIDSA